MGDIDPAQPRDFQAPLRPSVATVPEAIEPIRPFAAFGHETGIESQGLFMIRRHDRHNGGFVEGDQVKGLSELTGKGLFMIAKCLYKNIFMY
jgi:hypothetical protein